MVELLVVIGIVAVLVSLMLPALKRARDSAKRTVCMNNLHQIELGVEAGAGIGVRHDRRGGPGDGIWQCPADTFYPSYLLPGANPPFQYVRRSLYCEPDADISSYAFDSLPKAIINNPSRTVLVAEASAFAPWSWHSPSKRLIFSDAWNLVCFRDGHVKWTRTFWDGTSLPRGIPPPKPESDPPPSYGAENESTRYRTLKFDGERSPRICGRSARRA